MPRPRPIRECACGVLATAALLAVLTPGAVGKSKLPAKAPAGPATPSPFAVALARNWAAWDGDHDDTLSPDEVRRAVLDPAVHGEDAAAAAALKLGLRGKKVACPKLTRDYFRQYAAHATAARGSDEDAADDTADPDNKGDGRNDAGPGGKSGDKDGPAWDKLFAASRHRIGTSAGGDPTATAGPVALDRIRQGAIGDCFFVAVVGGIVNRDAASREGGLLRRVLTPLPGGGFRVCFAGAEPFVLPPLTDAERALGSTAGGDLLATLEQAYGRYRHRLHATAGDADGVGGEKGKPDARAVPPSGDAVEGTDVICHGGTPSPVVAAFTGHAAKWVGFAHDAAKRQAAADKVLPQLRQRFAAAFAARKLVCGAVSAAPAGKATAGPDDPGDDDPTNKAGSATLPSPPNITHDHLYAVLSYDARADTLTVWNPHGQTFQPKGPDGLANGYTTVHGVFHLPLREAYQFYGGFSFETDHGPTAKK